MAGVNNYLFQTAEVAAHGSSSLLNMLRDSTILVTGATGLIGSHLARVLFAANDQLNLNIKLLLPVRNLDRAVALFGDRPDASFVPWQLGDDLPYDEEIDFFVHAACGTSSRDFLQKPATTLMQIVDGGKKTLDAALRLHTKKYVFLSTMEVYGEVSERATEDNLGKLDPMVVRNSYPEAKRLVECMCASYASEFGLPAVVLRLAQTFGQGVHRDDQRVFAEFGRRAIDGNDIVLLSDGLKRNSYLSVNDAVCAILTALVSGKSGEAYNVANEASYCSVLEMAQMVIGHFGSPNAQVRREHDAEREATFRKSSDLRLATTKLRALGWDAQDSLLDMYEAMFAGWDCK